MSNEDVMEVEEDKVLDPEEMESDIPKEEEEEEEVDLSEEEEEGGEEEEDDSPSMALMMSTIDKMQETISRLESQLSQSKEKEEWEWEDQDFIGDVEIEDLYSDKGSANQFANRVARGATAKAREALRADLSQDMGREIQKRVNVALQVESFFSQNRDIAKGKNREYTNMVMGELAQKNPSWSMDDLLDATGSEVRKRLRLKKVGRDTAPAPRHARRSPVAKQKKRLSPLEQDVADLLEVAQENNYEVEE